MRHKATKANIRQDIHTVNSWLTAGYHQSKCEKLQISQWTLGNEGNEILTQIKY